MAMGLRAGRRCRIYMTKPKRTHFGLGVLGVKGLVIRGLGVVVNGFVLRIFFIFFAPPGGVLWRDRFQFWRRSALRSDLPDDTVQRGIGARAGFEGKLLIRLRRFGKKVERRLGGTAGPAEGWPRPGINQSGKPEALLCAVSPITSPPRGGRGLKPVTEHAGRWHERAPARPLLQPIRRRTLAQPVKKIHCGGRATQQPQPHGALRTVTMAVQAHLHECLND